MKRRPSPSNCGAVPDLSTLPAKLSERTHLIQSIFGRPLTARVVIPTLCANDFDLQIARDTSTRAPRGMAGGVYRKTFTHYCPARTTPTFADHPSSRSAEWHVRRNRLRNRLEFFLSTSVPVISWCIPVQAGLKKGGGGAFVFSNTNFNGVVLVDPPHRVLIYVV